MQPAPSIDAVDHSIDPSIRTGRGSQDDKAVFSHSIGVIEVSAQETHFVRITDRKKLCTNNIQSLANFLDKLFPVSIMPQSR